MRELQKMTPPIEGSCLCGGVTYIATAAPVWSGNCHCRECQKLSGAPFVSAFSVPAESFSCLGETKQFHRTAASGNLVTTTLCAKCGGRLYARSAGNPALVNVSAATLRDPASFLPVSNVYLSEAVSWIEPPKARFNFEKMPQFPERKTEGS